MGLLDDVYGPAPAEPPMGLLDQVYGPATAVAEPPPAAAQAEDPQDTSISPLGVLHVEQQARGVEQAAAASALKGVEEPVDFPFSKISGLIPEDVQQLQEAGFTRGKMMREIYIRSTKRQALPHPDKWEGLGVPGIKEVFTGNKPAEYLPIRAFEALPKIFGAGEIVQAFKGKDLTAAVLSITQEPERIKREEKAKLEIEDLEAQVEAQRAKGVEAGAGQITKLEDRLKKKRAAFETLREESGTHWLRRPRYEQLIEDAITKEAFNVARGEPTLPASILEGLFEMVPYMVAFGASRGIAQLGRLTVKGLAPGLLRQIGGKAVVGGTFRAVTVGIPGIAEKYQQHRMPDFTVERGRVRVTEEGEAPTKALAKAVMGQINEFVFEEMGFAFGKGISALSARVPGLRRLVPALARKARNLYGGRVHSTASRLGVHSLPAEFMEEHATDIANALTGAEDFGFKGEKNTLENRLKKALWPGMREMAIRAGVLGTIGGAKPAIGIALDQIKKRTPPADPLLMQAIAEHVAENSPDTTLRRYARNVLESFQKDEAPEAGLSKRVWGEFRRDMNARRSELVAAEEPLPEAVAEEAVVEEPLVEAPAVVPAEVPAVEEVREVPEAKPSVAPQRLVTERPAPPTEKKKAAPKVEKAEAVVKEEVAEEAREIAEEATRPEPAVEEIPAPELEKLGIKIVEGKGRGKRGGKAEPGSLYTVRSTEGEHPLERIIAAQLAEPEQGQADVLAYAKEVRADAGQEVINRALQILHEESSPQARQTKKRKALYTALDFQPEVGGAAGGMAAETVMAEYERLRKLLPRETVRKLMQDVTFWEGGTPINVTAKKLEAFARRKVLKPRSDFFIGAIGKQMEDKQLLEYIKAVMPEREHKMIAAALERVVKSRTPGERNRVIDGINRMIERHNKASAVKDFKSAVKDAKKGKLLPEFQAALDQLLADVALAKPSKANIGAMAARMAAFEKEMRAAEAAGLPSFVPPQLLEQARKVLARVGKTPVTQLGSDELRRLTDGIKALAWENRRKQQMRVGRQWREAKAVESQSAGEIDTRHGKAFKTGPGEVMKPEGIWRGLKAAELDLESLDTMANNLAGTNSVTHRVLWKDLRTGAKQALGHVRRATDLVTQSRQDLGISERVLTSWGPWYQSPIRRFGRMAGLGKPSIVTVELPAAKGRHGPLSIAATIDAWGSFLNNMKDTDTAAKATAKGQIVSFNPDASGGFDLTSEDVAVILQSPNLPQQLKAFANTLFEDINTTERDLLNKSSIEQTGFPKGTRNFYWPETREFTQTDPDAVMREHELRLAEDWGHYKKRVTSKRPMIFSSLLKDYFSLVTHDAAYIGRNMPVKNAVRLTRSEGFRKAVFAAMGRKVGGRLIGKIEARMRQIMGLGFEAPSGLTRMMNGLLRNMTKGVLGVNERVAIQQIISGISVLSEMDAKWMAIGATKVRVTKTKAKVKEWSDELWTRMQGGGIGIVTPGVTSTGIYEFFGGGPGVTERVGMAPIKFMDNNVVLWVWEAAQAEQAAKGLTGDALMRATARRTEFLFDRTQPTWAIETISNIQAESRGDPFKKLFIMFSSVIGKNYNVSARAVSDWKAGDISTTEMAKKVAVSVVIPSAFVYLIGFGLDKLWERIGGEPVDDEDYKDHIVGVLDRLLGNILVFGDVANFFIDFGYAGFRGDNPFLRTKGGSILRSSGQNMGLALFYAIQAIQSDRVKVREDLTGKALDRAIRGFGPVLGLPITRAWRISGILTEDERKRRKRRRAAARRENR